MRSIQYEKTEEKTKGDTAGRKSGIKESNKVGAKKNEECLWWEGRMQRRRERQMKRQSEGREVYLWDEENASTKRRHQQGKKWATSRTHTHTCTHTRTQRREDFEHRRVMIKWGSVLRRLSADSVFVRTCLLVEIKVSERACVSRHLARKVRGQSSGLGQLPLKVSCYIWYILFQFVFKM